MAFGRVKSIFRGFAGKVLDSDDTAVPREQLKLLDHYSARFFFDTYNVEIQELMEILKKKHMVDSISVTTKEGALVCSTNSTSSEQALNETALFNYITSELSQPETVIVKAETWVMFLPHAEKLYTVKASSNLTQTELTALAKEIEGHLNQ